MNKKGEVTVLDIFEEIKIRGKWVILFALICTLIGTALVQFVYNRQKITYTLGFELSKDFINGKYPDGSPFRYDDLLSKKILKEIKESNESFSSIDIDDMVQNDDIYFSYNVPESTEKTLSPSGENVNEGEWYRTVIVKGKYFKNKKQANEFLKAIVEYPAKKSFLLVKVADYESLLESFDVCRTNYTEKIEYLHRQRDYLLSLYEEQILLYGANYIVEEGLTLTNYRLATQNILTDEDISYLKNAVVANFYVLESEQNYYSFYEKGENSLKIMQINKEKKEKELISLQEKFKEIIAYKGEGGEQEGETFETKIAKLTAEIVQLTGDMETLLNKLARSLYENKESMEETDRQEEWEKYNTLRATYNFEPISESEANTLFYKSQVDFDALLSEYRVDLGEATRVYREIRTILSTVSTTVRYKTYYPVRNGGIGWAKTVIGLFFGTGMFTFLLFCCIDYYRACIRKREGNDGLAE